MKHILLAVALLGAVASQACRAEKSPATDTDSVLSPTRASDLYLGVVDGLIRQKRYQAAIAFLAQYQKTGVMGPRFRILAGQALAGAGRIDEAIASFRATLKSDCAAQGYDGIGKAEAVRGSWGEAAENFRQASMADPANADYLNNLGYALLKQSVTASDRLAAADALERAHELAPQSARIRNNLALADRMAGRTTELHTLLDTISDSTGRKLVTDFTAHWNPDNKGSQP